MIKAKTKKKKKKKKILVQVIHRLAHKLLLSTRLSLSIALSNTSNFLLSLIALYFFNYDKTFSNVDTTLFYLVSMILLIIPSFKILNDFFSNSPLWIAYYVLLPPRWNPSWRGEGAYLTKRFQAVHKQEELVGAMLLCSIRTNTSS